MASVLVAYATGEGQTAKVAERLVDHLVEQGHTADARAVDQMAGTVDFDPYDGVLVGASIHMGKHQGTVRTFASEHRDALAARPSGFFEVCLSAAGDEERQADAARYVEEFVDETGWDPDVIGIFGGALRYSKYGFIKRRLMRRIAAEATGDTDTSRDYEYTDWDDVDRFATDFGAILATAEE